MDFCNEQAEECRAIAEQCCAVPSTSTDLPSGGDGGELNTPVAEEMMSFSSISFQSNTSIKTMIPMLVDCLKKEEAKTPRNNTLNCTENCNDEIVRNGKVYRDMSCSPIEFESICNDADDTPRSIEQQRKRIDLKIPSTSSSSVETIATALSKSSSSDSLSNYNKPKLGEPGK